MKQSSLRFLFLLSLAMGNMVMMGCGVAPPNPADGISCKTGADCEPVGTPFCDAASGHCLKYDECKSAKRDGGGEGGGSYTDMVTGLCRDISMSCQWTKMNADLRNDEGNCGACGVVCNTMVGEACNAGRCTCGSGVKCGGVCTNTYVDPKNCGACGNACNTMAGEACNAGRCTCQNNGQLCNGACADLTGDVANCGACNKACAAGESCINSACRCKQDGNTACNGACVNTQSDPANCGGCGKACDIGAGELCSGGACKNACDNGLVKCGGACADLTGDVANCGACNKMCNTGACCSSQCVNTQSDPANCGGCNKACAMGNTCCTGACTNTQTDPANCGGCGKACAMGQACANGACVLSCGPGETACGGRCQPVGDISRFEMQTDPMGWSGCQQPFCNGWACPGPAGLTPPQGLCPPGRVFCKEIPVAFKGCGNCGKQFLALQCAMGSRYGSQALWDVNCGK